MRRSKVLLLAGFALTVMADPVSSVAYAVEAALKALEGDMSSLVLTMVLVLSVISLVAASYSQLIKRFPSGGGSAEAMAAAFGDSWAFLPLGALIVDFALTIAVSCAAGASAVIAYFDAVGPARIPIALFLIVAVMAGCATGRVGRIGFAAATLLFVGCSLAVIFAGLLKPAAAGAAPLVGDPQLGPILFAVPLGMALATGVEAPANAIAQLGDNDDQTRTQFGRWTLGMMLVIVILLTTGFAMVAVRLGVGEPAVDTTLIAETAQRAVGGGAIFGFFQMASALLLLAAAASSFLAGSGLLKALATHGHDSSGLLPRSLARVNRFRAPHWGLTVFLALGVLLVVAAGGQEQRLVHFYAVAVFASFLGALCAMTMLSYRDRAWGSLTLNLLGTLAVGLILAVNLVRVDALIALGASAIVSLVLWRRWITSGRPAGVGKIAA